MNLIKFNHDNGKYSREYTFVSDRDCQTLINIIETRYFREVLTFVLEEANFSGADFQEVINASYFSDGTCRVIHLYELGGEEVSRRYDVKPFVREA